MDDLVFSKGDVWKVDLGGNFRGHEQSGVRPAVVVADARPSSLVIILPTTTTPSAASFPHTYCLRPHRENGLSEESIVMVFQVCAVDKQFFIKKLGRVSDKNRKDLDGLLKEMLKL